MAGTGARALLGLGSNLDDPLALLRSAVGGIRRGALPSTWLARTSHVYETRPVGVGLTGTFLNAAIEVRTFSDARELMGAMLVLEREHGRVRGTAPSDRPLDLDLLVWLEPSGTGWHSRHASVPGVVLPHPRLADRDFVLRPLCDLDADTPIVRGRSARVLLDAVPRERRTIVRRIAERLEDDLGEREPQW
jgi:2-amino-4-hydroxy-6-hydroxymethyldihydropteridine diphosphokinase